ncbi:MAG: hypothetical protein K9N46_02240 [Candidatus Marinimicrobia bacterium]|nr:hypothetical protein [Candidatus Neomarinimicrobiota bacterium]MCF7828282.1 hypothetical protein [Candidatus Neomarinimicrobiota bacterium]MCF7879543.1 hypothetical protein [Candidatus Neomarinimicrobiota bacterium]
MKKINLLLLLTFGIVLFNNLYSQETHFRAAHWGMKKDDVFRSEDAKYDDQFMFQNMKYRILDTYTFNGWLLVNYVSIYYYFFNDRLVKGGYSTDATSSFKSVKDTYNSFSESLTQKYGEPFPQDPLLFSDEQNGVAYKQYWETPASLITLELINAQLMMEEPEPTDSLMWKNYNKPYYVTLFYRSADWVKEKNELWQREKEKEMEAKF